MTAPTVDTPTSSEGTHGALEWIVARTIFPVMMGGGVWYAIAEIEANPPDLVLLDVMLPGLSGVDVCRQIRKSSSVPVIMVTARAEEIATVAGVSRASAEAIHLHLRVEDTQ